MLKLAKKLSTFLNYCRLPNILFNSFVPQPYGCLKQNLFQFIDSKLIVRIHHTFNLFIKRSLMIQNRLEVVFPKRYLRVALTADVVIQTRFIQIHLRLSTKH